MQLNHLKQGFRLNRSIGFAFLVYVAAGAFYAAAPAEQIRLLAPLLLTLAFLLGNELAYRAIKHRPKIDTIFLDKCTLLVPVVAWLVVTVSYAVAGQLGFLLFSGIVALQAALYGHKRLARLVVISELVVYGLTLPLGYPHLLGFSNAFTPAAVLLVFLPFLLSLLQIASVVCDMVKGSQHQVTRLKSLAATDGLTGLINRRQFNHQLHSEIARAKRNRQPLTLALFDIDDFKKINDFHGHPIGDRILKELGGLVTTNVRESDIPARYGGEEFALILPETRQIEAYEILERLRALVEHTVFCLPDNPMTMTVSVGIAQLNMENDSAFGLVEQADAALYEAKKQGKNRVVYGVLPTPKLNLRHLQSY